MKKLEKVFDGIGIALNVVSIVALLVMVIVTLLNVFLKNVFLAPIRGSTEITRIMMVCMSPSFVAVLMHNRHVNVGLFVDRLGRKGQIGFDIFGYILSAVLCALISWQGFVMTGTRMAESQIYTSIKFPTWPVWLVFSISMGVFAIAIIAKLIINIADKDRYCDSKEGDCPPPQPEDADILETVNLGGGEGE